RHAESASARASTVKPRTDAPIAAGPQPCEKAIATAVGKHGYTADQIAAAYGLSSFYAAGDLGAGQTVAVLSLEPLLPADIETFQACYDTHTKVIMKTVGKGPGPYEGEDDETALDVEQLIGLAPRSRVLVYQTQNSGTAEARILSAWVSQDTAAVMTSSWGRCEERTSEERASTTDFLLQEAAAQGQTFFVASGDWGSTDCYTPNHGDLNKALQIDFPSGDPFATAVGGTRLEKPTDPAPIEYLWNETPKWGAGGGGISEFFPMPAYQRTARSSLNVLGPLSSGAPCGHIARYCRQIPDVSADAAPQTGYVVHSEEAWDVTGGTSAGAPFWAALVALINASPACDGDSIGFANPALYEIGGSAYAANFRDVTGPRPRGMPTINIFDASRPFPAGPGYDMATGIGTPLGGALGSSLCALLQPPAPTPPAPSPSAPTSPSAPAPPSPSSAAPPAHSPARVVHSHLAGLATGKPRLTVTVAAREDARIDAATLTLPAGLTAAKAKKDLTAGIVARDPSGHRLTARPQGAGRIIRVGFPGQTRVTLSVGPPAFVIAPRLRSQLRGGRAHRMRFVVVTRESDGPGARFPLSLGA
ncbi:MAG TPA: S53 family peptidase, partial [Solirubrobacterales bacterium]|nr:S53 family peptidase [Solirubrobacterales bacterium]